MSEFDRFQILSLDCYGPLIDWEAGIRTALRGWADRRQVAATDHELLELFARFETRVERERDPAPPYPDVLKESLRRMGAAVEGQVDQADAEAFGSSVGDWPAFSDSSAALLRLQRRYRLIIVSNVDRLSIAQSIRRLGVTFDRVITAEEVGAYKPRAPHFEALLSQVGSWGVNKDQLLHVAQSLFHDLEPAHRAGLATVWIDRRHDQDGYGATPPPVDASVAPDWRLPSMAAFADAALTD